jgi:transcriptional regulator with XRE-family HTH domain
MRMSDRLRARRLQLGLSLRELAELSGVSNAMIAKSRTTTSGPTARVQGRLCIGLDYPALASGLRSTASPSPSPGQG